MQTPKDHINRVGQMLHDLYGQQWPQRLHDELDDTLAVLVDIHPPPTTYDHQQRIRFLVELKTALRQSYGGSLHFGQRFEEGGQGEK